MSSRYESEVDPVIESLHAEIERLRAISDAQAAVLAIYNDEDRCHVEFDTQDTLDRFEAAGSVLEAAQAAKE